MKRFQSFLNHRNFGLGPIPDTALHIAITRNEILSTKYFQRPTFHDYKLILLSVFLGVFKELD